MEVRHNGNIIYKNVRNATSFRDRLLGLMFLKEFKGMDGLMIDPCKSIHMFFMYMSIDVVFLDKKNKIVKIYREFKPWRLTPYIFRAKKVLEVPSGSFPSNISEGEDLEVICIN